MTTTVDVRTTPDFKYLFDQAPIPFAVLDRDFRLVELNNLYTQAVKKPRADLLDQVVFDTFPQADDNGQNLRQAIQRALAGERVSLPAIQYAIANADGAYEHVHWAVDCIPMHKGQIGDQYLGLCIHDLTEQIHARDTQHTIARELQHRVSNLLAITSATARQTARHHTDLGTFMTAFTGRLASLQATYALLTGGQWSGLTFSELLGQQLAPFQILIHEQIFIEAKDFSITADHAQILSMALHELLTNAQKHGALKEAGGRLDISYGPRGRGGFYLNWTETGLVDAVAPAKTGFGSTILNTLLPGQTGGRAEQQFCGDSYVYSVSVDGAK